MHLQRLSLGPFAGKKIKPALARARTIEPGSYSVRVGDSYIIHAGSYLMPEYIDKLVSRFAAQGMKVQLEPVTVAGTLHRVRFGRFATQAEAGAAAHAVSASGMQVEVVKSR
jgi:cell division septation protein DedD